VRLRRRGGAAIVWTSPGERGWTAEVLRLLAKRNTERAAEFYSHHGFARIPGMQRLVRKIADLAEDVRD
jgi:hypothetical protein